MSNLYIRVKTGFYTHRKTVRLKITLGTDAYWIPPRLWSYAAENQPDGDLSKFTADEIAELIGFRGNAKCNAQAMLEALKKCGFIDESGMIHDWNEHNGYHERFAERAKKAAAARWSKEKSPTPPKEDKDIGKGKVETSIAQALLVASPGRPNSNTPEKGGVRFKKPNIEEIKLQCAKIGLPETEAEGFFFNHESKGWKIGNAPMVSWPAALQTWKRNYEKFGARSNGFQKPKVEPDYTKAW